MRRFTTPAFIFLIITILVSALVFYLSMKSGVAKISLPPLYELTANNVSEIKEIHLVEQGVPITSVSFSPDGLYLAVARHDNILHIWSTKDYHLIFTFQTESLCRNCIAFSPDSRYVAAVREDRPYDVIIWDLDTGKGFWESVGTLTKADEYLTSLTFSPDGRLLVGTITDRILFWKVDAVGCELVREIVGHSGMISSLAFSSDGQWILTTSDDKTAKVWNVETGNWHFTLGDQTNTASIGIFSPDDSVILTAGSDRTIKLWNNQTGMLLKTLVGHTSPVISLAFSPNGRLLASGGLYNEIILWDSLSWNPLLVFDVDTKGTIPLTFSPDNKIFITTSVDGALRLWGVDKYVGFR